MTWSRKFDHVSIQYKQLNLLKLEGIYKLELSKFMHQFNCNMTPKVFEKNFVKLENVHSYSQSRSTPTSAPPPPKVSARAPAHRSYHFRGVKLKSCIKKIHHNLYISKQANVRIKHADTEGASHKKFGTDARVQ